MEYILSGWEARKSQLMPSDFHWQEIDASMRVNAAESWIYRGPQSRL